MDKLNIFKEINLDISKKQLPNVDLHLHTNWTDGKNSVSQMYEAACKKGLKKILFSEHARCSSVNWFSKFAKEVKSLKKKQNCNAYVGAEVKILNFNGDLDINKDIIKDVDYAMASVHRFPGETNINKKETIDRYSKKEAIEIEYELTIKAIKNSDFEILGHPFGMSLSRYKIKPEWNLFKEIIKLCKKFDKAFEVNSYYHPNIEKLLKECIKEKTLISLGSNAHSINEVGEINFKVLESNIIKQKKIKSI